MKTTIKSLEDAPLILGYLGIICILVGIILLLPLLLLLFYPEEISNAIYFIIPGFISIGFGFLLTLFILNKAPGNLYRHQDAIIVVAAWIIAIVVSAMPFVLTGHYNFTQAVFECTSGYSTTGLSVVDTATAPKLFLFFRSMMLFFGGIGLVLVIMSVLPDEHGMRLYGAEGHADRLMPNLLKSARTIILLYSGLIFSGTVLYHLLGMSWFDAFNHSVSALSTGGFSTHPESIAYYNSVPIELATIILMLLGNTSFLILLFLVQGKFKTVITHCEIKLIALLCIIFAPILGYLLAQTFYLSLAQGLRLALFQMVSAFTTTGFQTVKTFKDWTSPMLLIMTLLMLIGGGAGSTAGGIKQFRICILLKNIWWIIRDTFSNKRIIHVDTLTKAGVKEKIGLSEKNKINTFVILYLSVFLLGTFIFTCFGYSVEASMFEFSSALGTVGLSAGITGYHANPILLWTATAGMFFGRLEIIIVFIAMMELVIPSNRLHKDISRPPRL